MKAKLKQYIVDFENGKIELDKALELINKIATTKVDRDWLLSYWGSSDIDEFIDIISIKEIDNWVDINDEEALKLIKEILEKLDSITILKNGEALEKRYRKSEGTVSDLVCQQNLTPNEILEELKKDTVIRL